MNVVECPICTVNVPKEKIEKHVDNCLRYPKEKPATRRSSTSPLRVENFFTKKSKRKRPKSPEDLTKRQCVEKSPSRENNESANENVVTTVIPDSPPRLPVIDTDCTIADSTKTKALISSGSFQETLFKWSQTNDSSSSDKETNKKEVTIDDFCSKSSKGSPRESKENEILQDVEHVESKRIQEKALQLGKSPLADQMRPKDFDHYFGQEAVSSSRVLKELFYNKIVPSLLLWGPPGCGKVMFLENN